MKEISTDICIIGGGAAGLSMASGAAQMGARTVLFESGKMGGDCLNYGCIPSKTLISSAKAVYHMRNLEKKGIFISSKPTINFNEVTKNISKVIDKISPHDSEVRFKKLGVNVIREHAKFTARNEVCSNSVKVNFKYAVIATGTEPIIPEIKGLKDSPYFTNETIFSLAELPSHLIIIGGGSIGIELAQAFNRLGAQVSVIESKSLLWKQDSEFTKVIRKMLASEGIIFHERTSIDKIVSKNKKILIKTKKKLITGSHILVSTGRLINTKAIGLEKAGVIEKNGLINTNTRLQTNNKRIYAIGDVITSSRHTNLASEHATVALKNILLKIPAKINTKIIPTTIYIEPELSQVGYTKKAAELEFGAQNIICIRKKFETNDRCVTEGSLNGLVQLVAKRNGKLIGATIFAPYAGELIQCCTFAITHKLKLSALARLSFPYPSYGETIKIAASAFYSKALFGEKMNWLIKLRFMLLP